MNITIIGFGNLAHALLFDIKEKKYNFSVLSSKEYGKLSINKKEVLVTNDASKVIPNSDLILFTTPAFLRKKYLKEIAPYLKDNSIVGAFPGIGGFDEEIKSILNKNISYFATQRVPYIARIKELSKSVKYTKKESINIALSDIKIKSILEKLLNIEVNVLNDFLEVSLSNSNPILHSARLYTILQKKDIFEKEILFYEEWDNMASEVLLAMDSEFMQIVKKLKLNIKSLKEHYEVKSIDEMTKKINSIEAFKGIKAPMIRKDKFFVLDCNSRYFSEDIDIGLNYIINFAKKIGIETPTLEEVYLFLKKVCN